MPRARLFPRSGRADHVDSCVLRSAPNFGGHEPGHASTVILKLIIVVEHAAREANLLSGTGFERGDFAQHCASGFNDYLALH